MKALIPLYALCGADWRLENLKPKLEPDYVLATDERGLLSVSTQDGNVYLSECSINAKSKSGTVISVASMEPPIVSQAWELLISIFLQTPCPVWISTYNRQYLETFGSVEEAELNGIVGFILRENSFDKMIS